VVTIQIADLLDVAKETGQHIEKGQRLAAYASTARMKGKMFLVPRVPGSTPRMRKEILSRDRVFGSPIHPGGGPPEQRLYCTISAFGW